MSSKKEFLLTVILLLMQKCNAPASISSELNLDAAGFECSVGMLELMKKQWLSVYKSIKLIPDCEYRVFVSGS